MQSVKASQLIGLPVLSSPKLSRLGQVTDLLYTPDGTAVCGLRLDRPGWTTHDRVLDYAGVLAVEETHLLAAEQWLPAAQQSRCGRELLGLPVLLADDQEAGVLDDLHLDPETGRVVGLELTRGLVDDLFYGKALLPLQSPLIAGEAAIRVDGAGELSGGTVDAVSKL